jgi:hypothetical protein
MPWLRLLVGEDRDGFLTTEGFPQVVTDVVCDCLSASSSSLRRVLYVLIATVHVFGERGVDCGAPGASYLAR